MALKDIDIFTNYSDNEAYPILGKLKFNQNETDFKKALDSRLFAGEEFNNIAKDLFGKEIKKQYGKHDFKLSYENFKDLAEQSFNDTYDFEYKDVLNDILQSDDPKLDIEKKLEDISNKFINDTLGKFDKTINISPNTKVSFEANKKNNKDLNADLDFRYSNKGKYGNLDLFSNIDEAGDVDNTIKYRRDLGNFSVGASAQSDEDPRAFIKYNLPSMSVGNAQTIRANASIDDRKNASAGLDYMYNNPNTGYFVDAGLKFNSQRRPKDEYFNLKFGKKFSTGGIANVDIFDYGR
jgi:hypothetical protein